MTWLLGKPTLRVLAVLAMFLVCNPYTFGTVAQSGSEASQLCADAKTSGDSPQTQSGQNGDDRVIQGASASLPSELTTVFAGSPSEARLTVTDAFVTTGPVGTFSPQGKYVIVCATIQPAGTSSKSISLSSFHIGEGVTEDTKGLARDETTYASFDVLGLNDAGDIYGDISRPVVIFPPSRPTGVALVFDIATEWSDLYLTHGGWEDLAAKSKEFAVPLDSLIGADASPQSAGTDLATSEPLHGVITEFGQTEIITVNLDKWKLTFDPNVEVRYFIGDHSITPVRGQFLVIWFSQEAANGNPLSLGNFQLRASEGAGQEFADYPLAEEGTAALILTEYNWTPQYMEVGVPYRTGIVFDIRPQDTHFELIYEVPGNPIGPRILVRIVFDA